MSQDFFSIQNFKNHFENLKQANISFALTGHNLIEFGGVSLSEWNENTIWLFI